MHGSGGRAAAEIVDAVQQGVAYAALEQNQQQDSREDRREDSGMSHDNFNLTLESPTGEVIDLKRREPGWPGGASN